MNTSTNNRPAKKLVIKKQSIVVFSAPSVEQRFPTYDC